MRRASLTREEAIDRLPEVYAQALRLHALGTDDVAIAAAVDVDPLAVPLLCRIAEIKLGEILAADGLRRRNQEERPVP